MKSVDIDAAVSMTRSWVRDFIVAHNICPFARKEMERGSIHYEVVTSNNMEKVLSHLITQCQTLDSDTSVETVMLILPAGFSNFERYLDLLDVAEHLLVQQGYEGVYQLASFHPRYCFEGVDKEDASHFTNRSPYPMLHILREEGVENVLNRYPNPEAIPERNVAYCRELGVEKLNGILLACKEGQGK